ncbi:MAG: prolyl oligopeptidase family serine peptidase [Oscillospiraceae bacterium]|nr:prolyl oligopeptidase family serine peptidase [Oscillospiraceae bacterium]
MIYIKKVTMPKLSGKEKRRAYFYVPDEAKTNPDARFPVLYMFDGHNVFFDSHATYGKSWGMLDYLQKNRTPLIVVGVECNHGANNERLSEYSPFDFHDDGFGDIKGQGKKTMDWFVKVLKPFVDRHLPTLPDRHHTFIAGSSMGGLMTLYAVSRYNHVFSRGAALSPSVGFAPDKVERMIITSNYGDDTVLYMDYGQKEFQHRPHTVSAFNRTANALINKGVLLNSRIVPDGEHTEASWEKQIPVFMQSLFFGL